MNIFRVGDVVVTSYLMTCTQNGLIGVIVKIEEKRDTVFVDFEFDNNMERQKGLSGSFHTDYEHRLCPFSLSSGVIKHYIIEEG